MLYCELGRQFFFYTEGEGMRPSPPPPKMPQSLQREQISGGITRPGREDLGRSFCCGALRSSSKSRPRLSSSC
ncbi:hypothetical protein NDU88_004896 [Pleurodeles waltl]|uniref:Uncharacterized protein n=1 Tax=Pleurodeles waltl TaxID=8319 RepID=A0AAV7NV22_PLEWA|nr:hypothetical protein NDU88_004896 [Pleurodeles waltl]